MRNLIDFLVSYCQWFLFALYVVLSCLLLFDKNPYQHHVYMTSAGKVASTVYGTANNVTSYFNLRQTNSDLQAQNARLESELIAIKDELTRYKEQYYGDTMIVADNLARCEFIIADVINNSIHRPKNYLTINKGALDGIEPEMGIIDQNGVVGIVNIVNDHYARVISLLNDDLRLSCKVKGNDAFGSLIWDGKSYDEALLTELPRHAVFSVGDTIITSGFSAVFPEGIPVGIIQGTVHTYDDNFYNLRIKLLTDFASLSTVRVIKDARLKEIKEVETDSQTSAK